MLVALLVVGCSKGGEVVGGEPTSSEDNNSSNTGGGNSGNANASHTAKVLIHDFTATWCGWCAEYLYIIEDLHKKHPDNVISIGIHSAGSGPDGSFTYEDYDVFNVSGTPTIWFNNNKDPLQNATLEDLTTKEIATKKEIGLAINYDLAKDKVTVKVRYDNVSNNNKLVVYMVEDKLKANQKNYNNDKSGNPAYQKGNPIPNFEHNNVLRTALTATLGNEIPNDKITDKLYTVEYAITSAVKGKFSAISNSKIIAFVVDKNGKVVNAQIAKVNQNKDFD